MRILALDHSPPSVPTFATIAPPIRMSTSIPALVAALTYDRDVVQSLHSSVVVSAPTIAGPLTDLQPPRGPNEFLMTASRDPNVSLTPGI